jgi:flagellar hook protein FlgE
MSSYSIALSGLAANNAALDVVGNNLANINTQSFKSGEVQFNDLMQETLGGTIAGGGVAPPTSNTLFTQGAIQSTGAPLDGAIQGNGFFVAKDTNGNALYTRDGGFQTDPNGFLVTSTGAQVQGWSAVGNVLNTTGVAGSISIAALSEQPPVATANMTLSMNLDATTAVNGTFSTPIQVVDSLGGTHTLTATFTETAPNAWSYKVTIPGEDTKTGTAGTPVSVGTGTLAFDASGNLTAPAAGTPGVLKTTGGLADGSNDLNINWSFYDKTGTPTITQFAQTSAATGSTQDGAQAAQLNNLTLSNGGGLVASYSNGKQVTVAQIALASIGNPDSLISVGNNDYQLGAQTSTPSVGVPGTGGRGTVLGGSIEASNVDLGKEFTNLIVYQRGYEANSKVISTQQQVDQSLLALTP